MPRIIDVPEQFIIVGENIHATRSLLRDGNRAKTLDDGTEVVPFKGRDGEKNYLTVPQWYKTTQPYEQGQIKHFLIAMKKGISSDSKEQIEGRAYITHEVIRQVNAGAKYLDINVDEVDYNLEVQKKAMRWTVETAQEVSPIPLSIDSSNSEIIAEGLDAYNGTAGRPLVNSVALERLDALDMALSHNAKIIVMATGAEGMPEDDRQRVDNANEIMEHVLSKGIALEDVFIDAIVFPISVDSQYGNHYFDAVRTLRATYGNNLHIGMGLSNVSFGMPKRKLINETFIYLALDAGIDAGLIDPVQTKLSTVFDMNIEVESVKFASEVLLGNDDFCMGYIQAFRDGRLV